MSEYMFDNPYLGLFSGDQPVTPPVTPPVPGEIPNTEGNTMEPRRTIDLGHVYHVAWPTPKCDENSERGIRHAHQHGWSIDLDMQKDAEGTILCDHWQELMVKDGWYDPEGKLDRHRMLNTLHPFQWKRLTTKHNDRLLTMDQALQLCGNLKVKARIEPKYGNHWTLEDAKHLHDVARQASAVVVVATLDTDTHWRERLHLFREAGFPDVRRLKG